MGALGGLFGATEQLPDLLARIGEALPFGAANVALRDAWIGDGLEAIHVLSLGATTVGASLLAAVGFRWE